MPVVNISIMDVQLKFKIYTIGNLYLRGSIMTHGSVGRMC